MKQMDKYSGPSNSLRAFTPYDLSAKLLEAIIGYKDLAGKITGFNQRNHYSFNDSLTFQIGRAVIKHCSPTEIIDWKIGVRDSGIMNDNDNEKASFETYNIIAEFINAESRKATERILVYEDREFDGKVFRNAPCYDYSIVCPYDQFSKYESIIFYRENHTCVISYYLDFISLFPVTMHEFEKVLFCFLATLMKEDYPANCEINDSLNFVKNINEILRMRYIDINDRMILAFLHLIYADNELSECCKAIYEDIQYKNYLTQTQIECMAS